MSALGSKAERQAKPRFQSLNINDLYRNSRGESAEPLAQKSSVPRQHGMQILGKVPSTRRPPANLPSLRAETTTPSGNTNDPNSWGADNKPSTTSVTSAPTLPSPATTPGSNSVATIHTGQSSVASWSAVAVGSVDVSGAPPHHQPPSYQSPQFQHEFPSLDGAIPSAVAQKPGPDAQYGPGPSLRPQTEGSWMQGGSRAGATEGPAVVAVSVVPVGSPTAVQAHQQHAPPHFQNLMPPFSFRGSGAGNFQPPPQTFSTGAPPPTRAPLRTQGGPQNSYNDSSVSRSGGRGQGGPPPRRDQDMEGPVQRPIIREEDLDHMEDIARDVGWAAHDDIDYNQKLAFSDDESTDMSPSRDALRSQPPALAPLSESSQKGAPPKATTPNRDEGENQRGGWSQNQGGRDRAPPQIEFRQNGHVSQRGPIEDDEVWVQRRRHQTEQVAVIVVRAKQRKDEEERKFIEIRQAANKKLQELDQKASAKKAISSTAGELKEAQIERSPSRGAHEGHDFRQMAQIGDGGRGYAGRDSRESRDSNVRENVRDNRENVRDNVRDNREGGGYKGNNNREREVRIERLDRDNRSEGRSERDAHSREREMRSGNGGGQEGFTYSRQFQSNLPPRLQKLAQQAERGPSNYERGARSSSNNSSDKSHNVPFAQQYDPRWVHPPQTYSKTGGAEIVRRAAPPEETQRHSQNQSEERFTRQASTHSLNRSMSDSSQRKLSVSSEDRNSTSSATQGPISEGNSKAEQAANSDGAADFGGSWADEPFDNDKVFDAKVEDVKPQEVEETSTRVEKKDGTPKVEIKIVDVAVTKVVEGPKTWTEMPKEDMSVKVSTDQKSDSVAKQVVTKSMESLRTAEKTDKEAVNEDVRNKRSNQRGRVDSHAPRGGRGSSYAVYRGGSGGSGRRGGARLGPPRQYSSHGGADFTWSETDGSTDDIDEERRRPHRSPKNRREDNRRMDFGGGSRAQREGFAPRGEPSRRGRGVFRNRGAAVNKGVNVYGPPSSKSPFGGEEKPKETNEGLTPDDRTKLMQQALSAGIMDGARGGSRGGHSRMRSGGRSKPTNKGAHSDEAWETTSEHSDSQESKGGAHKSSRSSGGQCRAPAKPKHTERKGPPPQQAQKVQSKSEHQKTNEGTASVQASNLSKKDALEGIDLTNFASVVVVDEHQEKLSTIPAASDVDGFQEVRNKKTGKERPKDEPQPSGTQRSSASRNERNDRNEKKERSSSKSGPKGVSNKGAPAAGAPTVVPTVSKASIERPRQSKIPPRFAKQKEAIRLQRQAQESNVSLAPMPQVNAWDKPCTAALRSSVDNEPGLNLSLDTSEVVTVSTEGHTSGQSSQRSTPGVHTEKPTVAKPTVDPKPTMDVTTPLVNTIIFENTSYKTAPVKRVEKRESEMFKAPLEIMEVPSSRESSLPPVPLLFTKNEADYEKDMKLFNFETDISTLTEDKSSKGLGLPRSLHSVSSTVQNTISSCTTELNLKIASVKNVWENEPTMPSVLEQHNSNDDGHIQHNMSPHNLAAHSLASQHNLKHTIQAHQNQMTVSQHNLTQQVHNMASQHMAQHQLSSQHNMNQVHNLSSANSYSSGFDPSMEHFGKVSESGDGEGGYSPGPQHPGVYQHAPPNMNKHDVMGNTNVCKVKPTQQSMHPSGMVGSQSLGLSPPPTLTAPQPYYQASQFGGMSAIPSPPAVVFNSSQAMLGSSQMPSQQGLYGPFQIDQNRSGFSQFPGPYGGGSAPYANYMQSPPSMPATPEMYQNITSQYRMGGTPFGQSQQLNNPSTVLISSTSNSLMSASVKPSSQQIGAIGSKSGSVGQHYNQQYVGVAFAPQQGPLQSNSYYTGASQNVGGSQGAFYQQQGSQGFSLPANMFNNNQPPPQQQPVQNFGSQFLSSPMQLAAAQMQQYRSAPQNAYMKSQGPPHLSDPCSRQLKSPLGEPMGPLKQAPPQPSPPQHKQYQTSQQVLQSGAGGRQGALSRGTGGPPRYPTPIQRPTGYLPQPNGVPNRVQRHPHTQGPGPGPIKQHYYNNPQRGPHCPSGTTDPSGKSPDKPEGNPGGPNTSDNNKDDVQNE